MAVIKKIVDTATIQNSRADSYWNENGFDQIYRYFRKRITPWTFRSIIS